MPSVATLFLGFFSFSLLILALIACANIPRVVTAVRHYFRLFLARRARSARMLADLDKLDSDARMLQGLFIRAENSIEDSEFPMESLGS